MSPMGVFMNDTTTQGGRSHDWILNLTIAISMAGMVWAANLSPGFGAMYEGLRLPAISAFIYRPAIYWGIPMALLAAWVGLNLALWNAKERRSLALKLVLLASHIYLAWVSVGFYWPTHVLGTVLRS